MTTEAYPGERAEAAAKKVAILLHDTAAVLNFATGTEVDTPEILEAIQLVTEAADKIRPLIVPQVVQEFNNYMDTQPHHRDVSFCNAAMATRIETLTKVSPSAAEEIVKNLPANPYLD